MIERRRTGKYKTLNKISHGRLATVYRAYDVKLNKAITPTVRYPQYNTNPNLIQCFHYLAQSAAELRYSLATIHNVVKDLSTIWLWPPSLDASGGRNSTQHIQGRR
jgi:hypothetical protein